MRSLTTVGLLLVVMMLVTPLMGTVGAASGVLPTTNQLLIPVRDGNSSITSNALPPPPSTKNSTSSSASSTTSNGCGLLGFVCSAGNDLINSVIGFFAGVFTSIMGMLIQAVFGQNAGSNLNAIIYNMIIRMPYIAHSSVCSIGNNTTANTAYKYECGSSFNVGPAILHLYGYFEDIAFGLLGALIFLTGLSYAFETIGLTRNSMAHLTGGFMAAFWILIAIPLYNDVAVLINYMTYPGNGLLEKNATSSMFKWLVAPPASTQGGIEEIASFILALMLIMVGISVLLDVILTGIVRLFVFATLFSVLPFIMMLEPFPFHIGEAINGRLKVKEDLFGFGTASILSAVLFNVSYHIVQESVITGNSGLTGVGIQIIAAATIVLATTTPMMFISWFSQVMGAVESSVKQPIMQTMSTMAGVGIGVATGGLGTLGMSGLGAMGASSGVGGMLGSVGSLFGGGGATKAATSATSSAVKSSIRPDVGRVAGSASLKSAAGIKGLGFSMLRGGIHGGQAGFRGDINLFDKGGIHKVIGGAVSAGRMTHGEAFAEHLQGVANNKMDAITQLSMLNPTVAEKGMPLSEQYNAGMKAFNDMNGQTNEALGQQFAGAAGISGASIDYGQIGSVVRSRAEQSVKAGHAENVSRMVGKLKEMEASGAHAKVSADLYRSEAIQSRNEALNRFMTSTPVYKPRTLDGLDMAVKASGKTAIPEGPHPMSMFDSAISSGSVSAPKIFDRPSGVS